MNYDVSPIRAHWNYSYASYTTFYWFHLTRGQPYSLLLYIVMPIVVSFVLYGLQLYSPVAAVVYCAILYALIALRLIRNMRRSYRQFTRLRPNGVDYAFRNEEIAAVAPGGASSFSGTYKYTLVTKVYETEAAFYIYLGSNALTMEKRGMAGGMSEELAELLKSRVGPQRYIRTKGASRPAAATRPSYVSEQDQAKPAGGEISPPSYVAEEDARQNAQPLGADPFMHCDTTPIVVHSEYDLASYRRFQLFHVLARRRRYPFVLALLLLFIVLEATILNDRFFALSLSFVMLLMLMPVLLVLLGSRKAHAAQSSLHPNGTDYAFYSNAFEAANTGGESISGASRMAYALLDRVYETRTAFYLYQMAGRAYLVEKRGVAPGRVGELAALLRTKVGRKRYQRR